MSQIPDLPFDPNDFGLTDKFISPGFYTTAIGTSNENLGADCKRLRIDQAAEWLMLYLGLAVTFTDQRIISGHSNSSIQELLHLRFGSYRFSNHQVLRPLQHHL